MSKKLRVSHKEGAYAVAVAAIAHWADLEGLSYIDAILKLLENDEENDTQDYY